MAGTLLLEESVTHVLRISVTYVFRMFCNLCPWLIHFSRDTVWLSPTPSAARLKRVLPSGIDGFSVLFVRFCTALRPQSSSLHATHATHSDQGSAVTAIAATLVHT